MKKQYFNIIIILFIIIFLFLSGYFLYTQINRVFNKKENFETKNKNNSSKLKIVINSYKDNEVSLKKLISSIKKSPDYKKYQIYVFIGGYYNSPTNETSHDGNITYIKCNHNSIDFTGLIGIMENLPTNDEYYFYLHDTCIAGPEFINNINKIDLTNASSLRLKEFPSMNIGIYSNKVIQNSKSTLNKLKNKDPEKTQEFKKMGVDAEDIIFKLDNNNKLINNKDHLVYIDGPFDVYKTGVPRQIEYYDLDLYKLKANWERKNSYELKV
jgi:cellulose synthase/poly-beta-1,6-N-acetylglucosamine synthase-like glycosyltransferase